MNLHDDDDIRPAASTAAKPRPSGWAHPVVQKSFAARLGGGLLDLLLLRDAELWARRLDEGDRRVLLAQVTRARQKLESARLLWAHEQYVEGFRLAEESVVESLRAAEQAAPALPLQPGSYEQTVRPLWADVLAARGASQEQIEEAMLVATGFEGSRPTWNGDLNPENRDYFRRAMRASEAALQSLEPLVTRPRRIVAARWVRILALLGVLLAVVGTTMSVRNAVDVRASGSFSEATYDAGKARDGKPGTEWLLPSNAGGWIELSFRPRTIKTVKLLNARNAPFHDRATRAFRIEGYLGKKLVHTSKHSFDKFEENPQWLTLPVTPMRVDVLKIIVDGHHKAGAGLAEIAFD